MSLLQLVGLIVVAGFAVWAIMKAPFIDADFKAVAKWIIIVAVGVVVLSHFVPMGTLTGIRVGH